jgi:hypothetical protein
VAENLHRADRLFLADTEAEPTRRENPSPRRTKDATAFMK